MKYSVYGMHRSGTNWLTKLLQKNKPEDYLPTNEQSLNADWKHIPQKFNFRDDVTYLYIYKNPHQWIESVARNCEDIMLLLKNLPQSGDFLIPTYRRGVMVGYLDVFALCTLYTKTLGFWLDKSNEHNIKFIYYNELLENVNLLQDFISVDSPIEDVDMSSRVEIKMQRHIDNSVKEYYKSGRPSGLQTNVIEYINSNVNKTLFDKLKIEKL